jgi:hypothetical protein
VKSGGARHQIPAITFRDNGLSPLKVPPRLPGYARPISPSRRCRKLKRSRNHRVELSSCGADDTRGGDHWSVAESSATLMAGEAERPQVSRLFGVFHEDQMLYDRMVGRGRETRTPDFLLPKQALYQAELCPVPTVLAAMAPGRLTIGKSFCSTVRTMCRVARSGSSSDRKPRGTRGNLPRPERSRTRGSR